MVKASSFAFPLHLLSSAINLGTIFRPQCSVTDLQQTSACHPFQHSFPQLTSDFDWTTHPYESSKMSIFGKLRRAKQAADTQKDKNAAKAEPAPYKHIPTHAATDALLGAPATWREQDRKAIQAQHQRRSAYNLSRNPSSLSNVTTLNRDQSFTSAGTDPRKRHSRDWVSAINVPYRSQLAPIAAYSSRMSQPPAAEQPSTRSSMRRSRFESPEPEPRAVNAIDVRLDRPYPGALAAAKDVKFYLPSSRGELRHEKRSYRPSKLILIT
jgi:hypothetical protein